MPCMRVSQRWNNSFSLNCSRPTRPKLPVESRCEICNFENVLGIALSRMWRKNEKRSSMELWISLGCNSTLMNGYTTLSGCVVLKILCRLNLVTDESVCDLSRGRFWLIFLMQWINLIRDFKDLKRTSCNSKTFMWTGRQDKNWSEKSVKATLQCLRTFQTLKIVLVHKRN